MKLNVFRNTATFLHQEINLNRKNYQVLFYHQNFYISVKCSFGIFTICFFNHTAQYCTVEFHSNMINKLIEIMFYITISLNWNRQDVGIVLHYLCILLVAKMSFANLPQWIQNSTNCKIYDDRKSQKILIILLCGGGFC